MFKFLTQLLALLYLTIGSLNLSAQSLSTFPDNPKDFLQDLKEYMTAGKNAEMEKIFKEFELHFNKGLFTEKDFVLIHQTSNLALEKKIPASPYFGRYLQNIILIKSKIKDPVIYTQWHEVSQELITNMKSRKLKPIKTFFEFGLTFFEKEALRFSEKGVSWYAKDAKYRFVIKEGEAIISFEKVNLNGQLKNDAIHITNAKGDYHPARKEWLGRGGSGHWEKINKDETKSFALQGNYSMRLDKISYQIDSVQLDYPDLYPQGPILGSYQDKMFNGSNKAKQVSYPRFDSYDMHLEIESIGERMKFIGGIRIQGEKIYGVGSKDQKGVFTVLDKQQKEKIKITGDIFTIKQGEQVAGKEARCVLYLGKDSLYHYSSKFKLDIQEHTIELNRGAKSSDRTPFVSSFHQMTIDANTIKWFVDQQKIELGHRPVSIANVEKKVIFESTRYFKEAEYNRLQNISSTNPIATIKLFSEKQKSRFLDANQLAKQFNPRFDVSSINSLLYDLVGKGFIAYDKEQKIVEVREKTFHYADAAQKKTSFDNIQLSSTTDSTNAILDLTTNHILASGVKHLEFNERNQVALKPYAGIVQLKKNRDMSFDGKLFAGATTFLGKDFDFEYSKNHINLDSIRYFDVFIPSGKVDEYQRPITLSIASRIEHAKGVLLIDAPENMGGEEELAFFPSFQSKEKSYIFYDSKETLNACYKRDSFYFQLHPFALNNLDRLAIDQLEFKGTMVSAEIFPDFEETVTLDPEDYSFSFTTQTPAAGYTNYQDKGRFNGAIQLSNKGFLGNGTIQYLGASIDSEDIIFRPHQMTGTAEKFNLKEDRSSSVEVPQTLGKNVSIDWRPYVDSMYIQSQDKAFALFKEEGYSLDGLQILTPGGLKGRGQFNWEVGKLNAKLMSFGAFSTQADTASLQILTFGTDDFAFDTKNVKTNLDFDKKLGWVKANDENHITTMPYNKYVTTLDEFEWDMEAHTITFKNEEGQLGDFTSIHPDKDSLHFKGATAFYDLQSNEMRIGGVPHVQASDALIYPEDGVVEIKPGGEMSTLQNAKIIADVVSKYHVINRATVDILGKKEYRASGFYEYNIGDRKQEIEFKEIIGTRVGKGKRSEKKTVTRASGEVSPDDHLFIDHCTEFTGDINLSAENVNLKFDGFAKIVSPILPKATWFSISCEADKNDLAIEYNEPKNYNGDPLHTGIFLSKEHSRLYPSVMGPLYFTKDYPIFVAKGEGKGLFKYHAKTNEFIFGDSMRVQGLSRYGNILKVSNENGNALAKGILNLGVGLDYVTIKSAGEIKTVINQAGDGNHGPGLTKMNIQAMAGIDLQVPDKLMKILITDLQASTFDARPVDYQKNRDFYEEVLPAFIPDSKVLIQQIAEMKNYGLNLPGKFNKFNILFGQLPLKWEEESQSFINTKEIVDLASVNGVAVNRQVKAYIEFKKPGNGSGQVYIYLVSPSEDWYFFGYKQGILSLVSSNPKFNETLQNMKTKELSIKQDDGEFLEIQPVSENSTNLFVNKIKSLQAKR